MMRMREVETQYPNLISRYYGQNKDVTVGLNSFNNFIAEEKKKRESNEPRIEAANKDRNGESGKKNEEVQKRQEGNEEVNEAGTKDTISEATVAQHDKTRKKKDMISEATVAQ